MGSEMCIRDSPRVLVHRAVIVSNDLYGSDTVSAFELAKGSTKPIDSSVPPIVLPQDLADAHEALLNKRRLNLILHSNAVSPPPIKTGDTVQVYYKLEKEKRGRWLSPRTVLEVNQETGVIKVPGSYGHTISAALEDVRVANDTDDFANHEISSIDQITDSIDDLLDSSQSSSSDSDPCPDSNKADYDSDSNTDPVQPQVGDNIEVFWPIDSRYYPGIVTEISASGYHTFQYDDGDNEALIINEENWRLSNSLHSSTVSALPMLESN